MKTHQRDPIIYALLTGPDELQHAVKRLADGGIDIDAISVAMNEFVHDRDFKMLEENRTRQGITAGSIMGGALGGLIGGVVSLGTAITGIGLVVVGPMLALAAAGGLTGGLMGHGVPEEEAHHLMRELREGKTMIAVHTKNAREVALARRILREEHAEELDELEAPELRGGAAH